MLDILEAVRVANFQLDTPDWTLNLVIKVSRTGSRITILAESISRTANTTLELSIFSKLDIIEVGDFISKKGAIYSFLRKDTLQNVEVSDGHSFDVLKDAAENLIGESAIPNSLVDMHPIEFKHFDTAQSKGDKFAERYSKILLALSRKNIIGPKLVAHYLNAAGHTTASGARWTPRLAFFLICVVDAPMERVATPKKRAKSHGKQGNSTGKQGKSRRERGKSTGTLNASNQSLKQHRHDRMKYQSERQQPAIDDTLGIEDLVRKLSRLGRITRQDD